MAAFVRNHIILNDIFVFCYGVPYEEEEEEEEQQQQQQHERTPCCTPETEQQR
jgi:hypothetical protein